MKLLALVVFLSPALSRAGTFAPAQASAASAELNGALTQAAALLDEFDGARRAYEAASRASGWLEPAAGLDYCAKSPLALDDRDTTELTFYGGCRALAKEEPGACRALGLVARTSLDDVTDCTGIYWDLALARALTSRRADVMAVCAGNIRFRKPEVPQAEIDGVCSALRDAPAVASVCGDIARRYPALFPTAANCLHAFGIYRGEDCASHDGDFDYQRRLCESAGDYARAYRAKSPGLCRDYLCRFLMGEEAACEDFLRGMKISRCRAQIGSPPRRPAPASVEKAAAFARSALLATADRPITDAERAAALRLHLMAISARPFEPAKDFADLTLLQKSRVAELLFRAATLREALGSSLPDPAVVDKKLASLRERLQPQ